MDENIIASESIRARVGRFPMTLPRDLLLHPVRLRIVQAIADRPRTPRQITRHLGDVAQATVYRHLAQLEAGGLIEVVDERRVRGTIERSYAMVTGATSLTGADVASATPEEHFGYFATFVGALLADYASYLDTAEPDLGRDRVGYRQIPLWLTDEELDELTTALRDAVERHAANEPGPGRRRRLLTTIVMPDDRTDPRRSA